MMGTEAEFQQYDSLISNILNEALQYRKKGTNLASKRQSRDVQEPVEEEPASLQLDFISPNLKLRQYAPLFPVRIYGRTDRVPIINLTGLLKSHVAYAASNYVVVWDYLKDVQRILPGHRNKIVALARDPKNKYFATGDWGPDSCVIIWDIFTGNPYQVLKLDEIHHQNVGVAAVSFSSKSSCISVLGAERQKPQILSIWLYESHRAPRVLCFTEIVAKAGFQHEIKFHPQKYEFFATTGYRGVVFFSWNRQEKKIYTHLPKLPKSFLHTIKKFTHSVWDPESDQMVTATMSGCVVIWDMPPDTGLSDPIDPTRNIREYYRAYKLGNFGITEFQRYKNLYVVGDEGGAIKFFDRNFRLLRWVRGDAKLPSISCIAFNECEEDPPDFQRAMRDRYRTDLPTHIHKEKRCFIRDYTLGMQLYHQPSETTIRRDPFICPDFFFGVARGNVYYCHLAEERLDLMICGTNSRIAACDVNPVTNHLALVTYKGEMILYDTKTHRVICRKRLFRKSRHRVTCLKFHPSGAFAFVGTKSGRIFYRRSVDWTSCDSALDNSTYTIKQITISADGTLMGYCDDSQAIGLYDYQSRKMSWMFKGKQRLHCKPVVQVLFFHDPEKKVNRFFSLGEDKLLVEYDISHSSMTSGLRMRTLVQIDQFSTPTAMTIGNPFPGVKPQILIATTSYKVFVYHPDDERIRRTCQGPAFGSPINKMMAIRSFGNEDDPMFTLFSCRNKLGVAKPPIDGNPSKFMAVLSHPTGVGSFVGLHDGRTVFSIGSVETICIQWTVNTSAVETENVSRGTGIEPFVKMLDRDMPEGKSLVEESRNCFCMLVMEKCATTKEFLQSPMRIRTSEIPTVLRFCGYFPTENEIETMIEEAEYAGIVEQGQRNEYIRFDDFIKLFANHRRFPLVQRAIYANAFRTVAKQPQGEAVIRGSKFRRLLGAKGDKLPEDELAKKASYLYRTITKESDGYSMATSEYEHDEDDRSTRGSTKREILESIKGKQFLDKTYARDAPLPMEWSNRKLNAENRVAAILSFVGKKRQVRKDYPALGYLRVHKPGLPQTKCWNGA